MKNVTKNAVLFLVLGFCPLKVEITQFPDGFRLNFVVVMVLLVFSLPLQKEWHLMRNFRSVYSHPSLHVNFPFEILKANLRHVNSLCKILFEFTKEEKCNFVKEEFPIIVLV